MKCLKPDENSCILCAEFLKQEKIVLIPTDTVYGFSGIVGKTDEKIRKIKGRSETKPFIQLISKKEDLNLITDEKVPEELLKFWPGPLTLIVKEKKSDSTVALRVPGDKWLCDVISMCKTAIYSTSANRSGFPCKTKVSELEKEFENDVDLMVFDGDLKNSIPSTIVSVIDGKIKLIREGAVKINGI